MSEVENTKETLAIIAKRTCEYLSTDMSLSIDNCQILPQEVEFFTLEAYTALINLKKDMSGTIGLSVSTSLAKFMVEQFMFGEVSQEEIDEMAGESVAEILNVVLGNVIKDFSIVKNGGKVDISTPFIMDKTTKISSSHNGLMVINEFNTDQGKLILTYFG